MAQAVEPIADGPGERPAPGGEPRQKGELEPLAVTAERVQTALPKERALYPGRFAVGYLLVVLFFGALLLAFALAWSQSVSDDDESSAWSTFSPTAESESERTNQIARFVGGRYRTGSGEQLVRVLGGPPAVGQDTPVSEFMVRDGRTTERIGADKALMFILCGGGQQCAMSQEASSDADARLVRREALELSLYTMRYLDVEPVVVLLPPAANGDPADALLFRRDDLKAQLDRPLSETLSTDGRPSATGIRDLEGATIDYLTLSRAFDYDFHEGEPAGTARMVLNPAGGLRQ
jgi:hypothetical protein